MLASTLVLALIGIVDQTRHQVKLVLVINIPICLPTDMSLLKHLRVQHAHYYAYNKGFIPFLR
jgi:hypothetical protein